MADRVENILGIDGVAERVRELEGEMSREEAALELVTDFVDGNVGDYDSREGKVEGAVRTAVALLTEGVVAAPIEGIDRVEILENDDGTEFVNVYYAGPIRSAGGTAQALSVLVADYARSLLDIDEYKARTDEVERYVEEINLYDKETGLQYSPKDKESRFIAENMPIMLDGEATGDEEVSGYRDLERVDTNSPRGGMCLVMAEGIALKAPKIQRYTRNLDEVDWPWLQDLIDGTIGKDEADEGDSADDANGDDAGEGADDDGGDEADEQAGPPRVEPADKYLRDLIAGRPVSSHPSKSGGPASRRPVNDHGFATAGVHPATMHLVDDFLATGTQIKTERPGKAAGVVPVDTIEGPTVRLANGDVRRIDDAEEALAVRTASRRYSTSASIWSTSASSSRTTIRSRRPPTPSSGGSRTSRPPVRTCRRCRTRPTSTSPTRAPRKPSSGRPSTTPRCTRLHLPLARREHRTVCALADAVEDAQVAQADGAYADPEMDGTAGDAHSDDGALVLPRSDAVQQTLEHLLIGHTQDEETITVTDWVPLVRTPGSPGRWSGTDASSLSEHARTYGESESLDAIGVPRMPSEKTARTPSRRKRGCAISGSRARPDPHRQPNGSPREIRAARPLAGRPHAVSHRRGRRGQRDVATATRHADD